MALFVLLVQFLSLSFYGVEGINKISMGLQNQQHIQPTNVNEFHCVDIYKQPAFDHPLLKNHKIQMNPSFSSKLMKNKELSFAKYSNFELPNEGCPSGMVPIQKNRINDQTNLGNIHPLTDTEPNYHYATIETAVEVFTYHGASAIINIHNPKVKKGQFSMAQIWLQTGPPPELNSIQVGWAVHPNIYGDNQTRLTARWTVDNFQKTGCYNVICPGFVQVHSKYTLGIRYANISVPNGEQFATELILMQDKETGNWWLTIDSVIKVGYWPKEIFTHLSTGATFVRFGGWTYGSPDGMSPPMGSGLFPTTSTKQSSWFMQLKVAVGFDNLIDLNGAENKIGKFVDNSSCYDLKFWGNQGSVLKQIFTYGGPGGMCGV